MPVTLAELRPILSRYAGNGNDFVARLNEARARLIQGGNWKGTKEEIALTVYTDANDRSIVSLPRGFDTILAGAVVRTGLADNPLCTGTPLGVRNGFAEFERGGLGYGALTRDFQEVTGRFALFQEWSGTRLIRFKFDTSEAAGVIHLTGKSGGADVYTTYNSNRIRGEKIAFTGSATVTSATHFDAAGLSAVKPVTLGKVSVYAVDSSAVETLVGVWEPNETVPRLKRYKVPTCDTLSTYIAVAKIAFVPVVNDDEEVVPGNIGALKKSLQALLKEDAEDDVRAASKWADARALLAEESENETGPGAEGTVQVADDFQMERIGAGGGNGFYEW